MVVVEPDATERRVTRTTWPFGPGSLIVSDLREKEEEANAGGKARMDSKKSAVFCWRTSQDSTSEANFLLTRSSSPVMPMVMRRLDFGERDGDRTRGVAVRRSLWPICRWSNVPPTATESWDGGGWKASVAACLASDFFDAVVMEVPPIIRRTLRSDGFGRTLWSLRNACRMRSPSSLSIEKMGS